MNFWTIARFVLRILAILLAHQPTAGDVEMAKQIDTDGDGKPDAPAQE